MLTIKSQLKGRLDFHRRHTFATTWEITKTNGDVLRFTDHPAPLTLEGGGVFQPAGGWNVSALEQIAELEGVNRSTRGVITSDDVTEEDLRLGYYNGAEVIERLVDWKFPSRSVYYRDVYYITATERDSNVWTAELEGLAYRLQQLGVGVLTRGCRVILGGTECGVNLASFTHTGTVTAIDAARQMFRSNLTSQADGYFDDGVITFTSGANNGLSVPIKSYLQTNGTFQLERLTPFDLSVSTFSASAGCDHTFPTCVSKFSNGSRNRGHPHIPGAAKTNRVEA